MKKAKAQKQCPKNRHTNEKSQENGNSKCPQDKSKTVGDALRCPICSAVLSVAYGEQLHPDNLEYGVTLFCLNRGCPAQEVAGHGRNVREAYSVILAKYCRS